MHFGKYRSCGPDLGAEGVKLLVDLMYNSMLDRATALLHKIGGLTTGIRMYLDFCKEIPNDLMYRGVFINPHPNKKDLETVYGGYVQYIMQGRHAMERGEDGRWGPSPAKPSTGVSLYAISLLVNKLFGRDVVGLDAGKTIRNYAKTHIKKEKVWLSRKDYKALLRGAARRVLEIRACAREWEKEHGTRYEFSTGQLYDISGYFVLVLTCICVYRIGNVVRKKQSSLNAFWMSAFTFVRRLGVRYLRVYPRRSLEKGNRLTGESTPELVEWREATPEQIENDYMGPVEILDLYLVAYNLDLGTCGDLPILKPVTGSSSVATFLYSNATKWLRTLEGKLGLDLTSLDWEDGSDIGRLPLGWAIMRRSSISNYADGVPIDVLQRICRHKNPETTLRFYCGMSREELINISSSQMNKLFSEGTGWSDEHNGEELLYHWWEDPTGFYDEHPLNIIQPIVFKEGPDGGESSGWKCGIMHSDCFLLVSDFGG